jgi:hypothetical protein
MTDDIGETIDCPNCGHANPPWARICRNCGVSLSRAIGRPIDAPQSPFPTDQASLLSLGAAIGSIVIAIVLGLIFSTINPTQPTVGLASSQTPTEQPSPSASAHVAASPTPKPTPAPTPKPPGKLAFGTGLNRSTRQVIGPTTTFRPGGYFAHSVSMPQPFGVATVAEEVLRIANGKETVVQSRTDADSQVHIPNSSTKVIGFIVKTDDLIAAWQGGGQFVMRVWRGNQKIAEGRFTLSSG